MLYNFRDTKQQRDRPEVLSVFFIQSLNFRVFEFIWKRSEFDGKTGNFCYKCHCVKKVRIRSYSGPYSVLIRENADHKNSESDAFHAVCTFWAVFNKCLHQIIYPSSFVGFEFVKNFQNRRWTNFFTFKIFFTEVKSLVVPVHWRYSKLSYRIKNFWTSFLEDLQKVPYKFLRLSWQKIFRTEAYVYCGRLFVEPFLSL